MTRAMGHSPNGQDPQGLEAKPEWPGLASGEMRSLTPYLHSIRTPSMIFLERVADQLERERAAKKGDA